MRVFISWSGTYSERVAGVLRDWLPMVLQSVDPWVSSEDIAKGNRWSAELEEALRTARFGILCVTPENAREPWVNFEAGAMSNAFESVKVSPLLFGIDPGALPGPLAQFQCTRTDVDDVRRLIHSINECLDSPVPKERVNQVFDLAWPNLSSQLESIGSSPIAETTSSPVSPEGGDSLPESQLKILVLLGENASWITAEQIASSIGENLTRTKYHLDQLVNRELIINILNMRAPTRYALAEDGRAYLVENDLV